MHRGLVLPLLVATAGCATAKLAQEKSFVPADPGVARNVVLEPFFEIADWKVTTRTDYTYVSPGGAYPNAYGVYPSPYGFGGTGTVPVTTLVTEKPLFARADVLAELQRRLLLAVQERRPSWRVTSTGGVGLLDGEAVVVRTVIEGNEVTVSDRTLRGLCFGVGLIIWPLLFCAAQPVEETEHVTGLLERFTTTAEQVKARLVKYPTQPDYAVNLAGVPALRRPFGLDVTYQEGVVANEGPRRGVLVEGLVDRLAAAVVAIVEDPEVPSSPPPTPAPATLPP
ncbi:MAG: hypothetical protein AB1730_17360 [Myxococcota bacterium]